jgi:transposase-like protein
MIRLFAALCKSTLEHLSDETTFQDATDGFKHYFYSGHCPRCGAKGKLTPYGHYFRNLVTSNGNNVNESRISPVRFECRSCGKTHALLPGNIIPYSPYSLRFKLTVLIAYFERTVTVVAICEQFGIAVSTLYAWKHLLLEHRELLLGVLLSLKTPALAFLRKLFASDSLSDILGGFFDRYGFSFLQNRPALATRSCPP